MIKPEDFKTKMDEVIANLTDQAKVTTILADLTTEITTGFAELTTATTNATTLTADNEKLRQANMSLFMKIGETPKVDDKPKPEDNTLKFEALFNDKGELK